MSLWRRARVYSEWPIVKNHAGFTVRGVIKRASVQDILRLGTEAAEHHWSARARPVWLRDHAEIISALFVTILSEESGYIRCSVIVVLSDGSGGHFSLDVDPSRFEALEDVSQEELVALAHRYFRRFPSVPLDPDQQAGWDRPDRSP
jgi:hypothetical protein